MSRLKGIGAAALLLCGQTLAAQDAATEVDARVQDISKRLRSVLAQQSRTLSVLHNDLQRAARATPSVRDSIVRITSQRIAECIGEISRVQSEADRLQAQAITDRHGEGVGLPGLGKDGAALVLGQLVEVRQLQDRAPTDRHG